jgi:hypothetical protein
MNLVSGWRASARGSRGKYPHPGLKSRYRDADFLWQPFATGVDNGARPSQSKEKEI